MKAMPTEYEILKRAAIRLGILAEEHSTPDELFIRAYYDIVVGFDAKGEIIEIDTHP